MATAIARSSLRTSLRGGARANPGPKRTFSSSAGRYDAKETAKWKKIIYAGIVSCPFLSNIDFDLSDPQSHFEEPPAYPYMQAYPYVQAYPYMHFRNKEYPWGPNGLSEVKHD